MAEFTQAARVLSVNDLTPYTRQLVLRPTVQNIVFRPGQWVSLKLPVGAAPPLNRAYSTVNSPDGVPGAAIEYARLSGGAAPTGSLSETHWPG